MNVQFRLTQGSTPPTTGGDSDEDGAGLLPTDASGSLDVGAASAAGTRTGTRVPSAGGWSAKEGRYASGDWQLVAAIETSPSQTQRRMISFTIGVTG